MVRTTTTSPQKPCVVPPSRHFEFFALRPGIAKTAIHLDALDRYRQTKVHFVDCLIAATASAQNTPLATFDQGFRKFTDVRVETQ